MEKVSLKDIAQRVGVSTATVSLVLNGKEKSGRIGSKVAGRIKQVAKEMNYSPNNLARGLRMGHSNTIGLIVADISNLFFANLAFQIQEYAEKFGYTVIITNTNESDDKMGRMISIMKSRQVDGFIIVPAEGGEDYIDELQKSNTPMVLLDRYFPAIPTSHVVVNNYHASFEGTNLLIKSGCKNIALLIYNNQMSHMSDRRRGYEDALKKANLYHPDLVKVIGYNTLSVDVRASVGDLIQSDSNAVDGIFFASNSISMMGIKSLQELNVDIPNGVKVVCFDKSDAFDFAKVPIPHIQQPISEMGKMTVDILIEQIKKERITPMHVELYASLVNTFL